MSQSFDAVVALLIAEYAHKDATKAKIIITTYFDLISISSFLSPFDIKTFNDGK